MTTYKRVLLKLSGESLKGDREFGLDPDALQDLLGGVELAARLRALGRLLPAGAGSGGSKSLPSGAAQRARDPLLEVLAGGGRTQGLARILHQYHRLRPRLR